MRRGSRWCDRRSFLGLGSTGLATVVSGCQWERPEPVTDESPPSRSRGTPHRGTSGDGSQTATQDSKSSAIPYADSFENVVDVVEDAGADPDAGSSILPVLEDYAGDETLLYFPPGRYRMDDIWLLPAFDHLGIVGENATIVPAKGYDDYLFAFGLPDRDASRLIFQGIDFDFRADGTHPRPLQVQVDDAFLVQDVSVRGSSRTTRFDVTSEDGRGVVRRVTLPDGGPVPDAVGILVSPESVGAIRVEDCHVEGFPNNGLYASPATGSVSVDGGYYANNGIANVRVSDPALVSGVRVRCDRAPEGFRNMRGIRLRHGNSVVVEDCTIEMERVTYSEGAIVVEPRMGAPTIRNVEVSLSADGVMALNAKTPTDVAGPSAITCEGVTVRGTAGQDATIRVVDRDECSLDGVDIEQTGPRRDGIHLIRSDNVRLRSTNVVVSGEPLVLEESSVRKRDVSLTRTG